MGTSHSRQRSVLLLVIAFAAGVLLVGCVQPETRGETEYKKGVSLGIREAMEEIESGELTIYAYGGIPAPAFSRVKPDGEIEYVTAVVPSTDEATGLPLKRITACMVFPMDTGRRDGHNKMILEHLSSHIP